MKIVAYTPADKGHDEDFRRLETSLRKFHSEKELPLLRFDNPNPVDKNWWYRATPILATKLFAEGYDTLVKLDADQIITGSLEGIWDGDFDVATVFNDPTYPIQVWDINPYYNNGLVVIKSSEFASHWMRLCFSEHFDRYQFREQDILNILASNYHNYKIKQLEANAVYGESAKALWSTSFIKDNKLFVKHNEKEVPVNVIHFGGGNTPDKGNYRIRFPEPVIEYIDKLIK